MCVLCEFPSGFNPLHPPKAQWRTLPELPQVGSCSENSIWAEKSMFHVFLGAVLPQLLGTVRLQRWRQVMEERWGRRRRSHSLVIHSQSLRVSGPWTGTSLCALTARWNWTVDLFCRSALYTNFRSHWNRLAMSKWHILVLLVFDMF